MRKWVHVKGLLKSITISDPTATMGDMNQTQQMTLNDYMYYSRSAQPSCITLSALTALPANFKIKYNMIQMLPVFRGLTNENPYQYVREFKDICGNMKYNQMMEKFLNLRLFPFSVKEKAKTWLLSL